MTIRCEKVRDLLGRFYDKELRGRKLDAVSEHLKKCAACSGELERLESMSRLFKAHYEKIAAREDLSRVWGRVSAAIETQTISEPEPLLERLKIIFSLPKPAWAIAGVAAIVLVLVFAYMPGNNHVSTLAANDCIIDKVDAEDYSVMVYEAGASKMKIIWVLDQGNGATENGIGVTS